MSLLVDPSRSRDRGAGRNRSNKRVRSVQEAKPKDTYYRKEYGWIMSDADVAKEKQVKGQYDKAVKTTERNITKARTDMNSQIASGRSQINGAYDKGIANTQKGSLDLVPVRVVNGNTVEHIYYVPKSYAQEFSNTKGMRTAWFEDGSMNIDVRVDGKVQGKEIHTAFIDADKQVKAAQAANNQAYDSTVAYANEERNSQLSGFGKANAKSVATAEKQWASGLETAKGAYGKRIAGGKQQYEKSKKSYNDSVMGMDEGLLESRTSLAKPKRLEQ